MRRSNPDQPQQFPLEFASPEELAERARFAKQMADWLAEPSPPEPPPLPLLAGWENVERHKTRCEVLKSDRPDEVGKFVVVREFVHGRNRVWVSLDEPVTLRLNRKGRWVTAYDPSCAPHTYAMEDLRIVSEPWTPKPPVYEGGYRPSRY